MAEEQNNNDGQQAAEKPVEKPKSEGQTFTQADVDRIVSERVKRAEAKYADYDDLKAKVGEKASADDRIAKLEADLRASQREALKRRVQAAHGISDEDADLFLTGADEDSLTAQAKRLAERESERKKQGNRAPKEGTTTGAGDDPMREFASRIFGNET